MTELPDTSYFSSADSFAMVRGSHIDLSILGAPCRWPEQRPRQLDDPRQDGQGNGRRDGSRRGRQARGRGDGTYGQEDGPKLLHRCNLPLTGERVVDMVITPILRYHRQARQ